MVLVDYSDSDDSGSEARAKKTVRRNPVGQNDLKRKRSSEQERQPDLPPLPESFHDMYASNARISKNDDPSLHDGRQRQVPHVEGQWPTHVYIECTLLLGALPVECPWLTDLRASL